jgi:hypothetical protein
MTIVKHANLLLPLLGVDVLGEGHKHFLGNAFFTTTEMLSIKI